MQSNSTDQNLHEKIIVDKPINQFPAFYGAQKFIIVFTRTRRCTMCKARWILSTNSYLIAILLYLSILVALIYRLSHTVYYHLQ
jgi:hypothetical protein